MTAALDQATRAYRAIERSLVGIAGEAAVGELPDGRRSLRFEAAAPCPVVVERDGGGTVEGELRALVWPFDGDERPDHALKTLFQSMSLSDEPVPEAGDDGRRVLVVAAELPCLVEVEAGGARELGRLRAYRWYLDVSRAG